MSYLRLWVGRGCGHSKPASYEFRCAAGPSPPELRCCGQLLRHEYLTKILRKPIRYGTEMVPTVPWYRRHGGVLDKAEQDGGRGSCKKLAQRKNRRMRGCTG